MDFNCIYPQKIRLLKVTEKTPHILVGQYESPEPRMGVFGESIMVKMKFEVTMGLYRKGACLIK